MPVWINGVQISTEATDQLHGEMFDFDNTDAYVIAATAEDHAYHTNGLAAGQLNGWTFDAGGGGTSFPIASVADGAAAGVDIEITTTGTHGLAVGDIVSHSNCANPVYNGMFVVKAIISTTEYEVLAVFTATDTGTMDQAATLDVVAGSDGNYQVTWSADITPAASNDTFDFGVYVNAVVLNNSKSRTKLGTAADFAAVGGVALFNVVVGDKVSFGLINTTGAGNCTLRNLTISIIRH